MQGIDTTSLPRTGDLSHAMAGGWTRLERALWMVAIVEIPLQFDKYLFFRPEDASVGSIGGLNVSLTSICIAGLLLSWWLRGALQGLPSLRPLHLGWLPLGFLVISGISGLAAADRQLVMFEMGLLLQAYLLYFLAANRIATEEDVRWVMGSFVVSGVLQSALVFLSIGLYRAAGIQELSLGPVDVVVSAEGRPGGTLRSPTGLGSMLTFLLLLSAPCAALVEPRWRWVARGGLAMVLAGLPAIALTQTRAAVGTSLLGMAALTGWLWQRGWLPHRAVRLLLMAGVAAAGPWLFVLQERVLHDDRGSAASRLHMSQIAWELIRDRGLFGVGAGNAHVALQEYATQSPYRSEWFYLTHCKYLIVWAETGVLGLAIFVGMLVCGIARGAGLLASAHQWHCLLGLGVAVSLSAQALHMFVDLFNARPHVEMLWLVLGLAVAVQRIRATEQDGSGRFVPGSSR